MNLQPANDQDEPDVNLTSLIDVVLLLLVFFMISTSFVKESDLRVELPKADQPVATQQQKPLEIVITQDGNYSVAGKPLVNTRPATLRSALAKVAGDKRDMPLTIRADARTTHQSVVTVLDVAGRMGFDNVNIVTVNAQPN